MNSYLGFYGIAPGREVVRYFWTSFKQNDAATTRLELIDSLWYQLAILARSPYRISIIPQLNQKTKKILLQTKNQKELGEHFIIKAYCHWSLEDQGPKFCHYIYLLFEISACSQDCPDLLSRCFQLEFTLYH